MTGWRVFADADLCQAHQNCQLEAPDVFGFDAEADKVLLRQDHPADPLKPAVRRAVAYCPAMALTIVDQRPPPVNED